MKPSPPAKALAKLLLLEGRLSQFSNNQALLAAICNELQGLPGVLTVWHEESSLGTEYGQDKKDTSLRRYPIALDQANYGELVFRLNDWGIFQPFDPYIQSLCAVIAVNLNERRDPHQHTLEATSSSYLGERESVEQALIKSEENYRSLFEGSPQGILVADREKQRFIHCNSAICVMLQYTEEELLQMGVEHIHPPEVLPQVIAEFTLQCERKKILTEAIPCLRKDGTRFYADITAVPMRLDDRDCLVGFFNDITERKRTQDALRRSEEKFRTLHEMSPIAIVLNRLENGQFLESNQALWEMTGYSEEELKVLTYWDITPIEYKDMEAKQLESLHTIGRYGPYEKEYIRKGGVRFPVLLSGVRIKDADGVELIYSVVQDLTTLKRLERERLELEVRAQQAHKLESIGVLAGGIAHDFNNLLHGLFGFIERARELAEQGATDKIVPALTKATDFIERGNALTSQLLTFAKGGLLVKKTVDLCALLRRTVPFTLSGSNVESQLPLPKDLWPCDVDENQISQAIDNVVRNAREAMPQGGMVTVTAENIPIECQRPSSLKPGKYVRISIEDHGFGIPADNLRQIFDPFFTTKEKGHGLGLSIVYSIINKHGGCVEVQSESGKGTVFSIYLPASSSQPLPDLGSPSQNYRGQGKILVMDDEPMLVELAGEMMKELGYSVQSALNGKEAVELYRQAQDESQPFDAVILDLTVRGGMGGRETVQALLKLDPQVKAIVSSGYGNDPVLANFKQHGFKATLAKPYLFTEMGAVLHKVLGKA